jgi:sulfopyruvate decarboxylase TPP-binding subunit
VTQLHDSNSSSSSSASVSFAHVSPHGIVQETGLGNIIIATASIQPSKHISALQSKNAANKERQALAGCLEG